MQEEKIVDTAQDADQKPEAYTSSEIAVLKKPTSK